MTNWLLLLFVLSPATAFALDREAPIASIRATRRVLSERIRAKAKWVPGSLIAAPYRLAQKFDAQRLRVREWAAHSDVAERSEPVESTVYMRDRFDLGNGLRWDVLANKRLDAHTTGSAPATLVLTPWSGSLSTSRTQERYRQREIDGSGSVVDATGEGVRTDSVRDGWWKQRQGFPLKEGRDGWVFSSRTPNKTMHYLVTPRGRTPITAARLDRLRAR